MRVDVASWLSLVTRGSVTAATATVTATEPGGIARELSEHQLQADDLLHWSYMLRSGGEEVHQSCDGREMVRVVGGNSIRSQVPAEPVSMDDPWWFYSWAGVVDAWLVEMLRPVDLLARVVLSSIEGHYPDGLVRIEAAPMGNELSPYNGFSVPDGRALSLVLDVDGGCFTEVTVTHPGQATRTHRLTRFE
jgi:hypothetical protein